MKSLVNLAYLSLLVLAISCNNQDENRSNDKKSGSGIKTTTTGAGTGTGTTGTGTMLPNIGPQGTVVPPKTKELMPVDVALVKDSPAAVVLPEIFPADKFAINTGKALKVSFVFLYSHARMDIADVKDQLDNMEIKTPYMILGIIAAKKAIIEPNSLIKQVEDYTHKKVLKLRSRTGSWHPTLLENLEQLVLGENIFIHFLRSPNQCLKAI